jgi:hypothetical protein
MRTSHAIAGNELSTFDRGVAARHQAAGWQARNIVVGKKGDRSEKNHTAKGSVISDLSLYQENEKTASTEP